MALSFIELTIWGKTHDKLKPTKNLDTFQHNLKERHLKEHNSYNCHQLFILKTEVCNISPFLIKCSF